MADSKISQLTAAATPLVGTEETPIVQGGSTKKVAIADLVNGRDITPTGVIAQKSDSVRVFAERLGASAGFVGLYGTQNSAIVFDSGDYLRIASAADIDTLTGFAELFRLETNGNLTAKTGNLIIGTSGKGIDFSATSDATGMTSELLDDYEEGTWTPVYTAGGGSFTTMTMDVTSAVYTKVGRLVTVTAHIKTSNVDATGASGDLYITGLPFTCNYRAPVQVGIANAFAVNHPLSGFIFPGTTFFYLEKRTLVNGATSINQVTDLTTGAVGGQNELVFSATYYV